MKIFFLKLYIYDYLIYRYVACYIKFLDAKISDISCGISHLKKNKISMHV